jgi:ankyrin repeat protein
MAEQSALQQARRAAREGDAATLRSLLREEGELVLRARDAYGLSALHYAAEGGSEECVQLLLDAGADKAARARDGRMAWRCTASARVAQLLLPDGADARASALVAATVGDEAALRDVLAAHGAAALAESDERGFSALHVAARRGDAACVRALLDAGAERDAESRERAAARRCNARVPRDATPRQLSTSSAVTATLARAEARVQLVPLVAAAGRGALLDARLFDPALWRTVARFLD